MKGYYWEYKKPNYKIIIRNEEYHETKSFSLVVPTESLNEIVDILIDFKESYMDNKFKTNIVLINEKDIISLRIIILDLKTGKSKSIGLPYRSRYSVEEIAEVLFEYLCRGGKNLL